MSITSVLALDVTLNILLFCDSPTLSNISLGNRLFYYLTCRDKYGDQILWRNLFLSELKLLQQNRDPRFKSTINKYLTKDKTQKKKNPIHFTDDEGNLISLNKIYWETVDLGRIEVMGPGENKKNILQWKSAYSGHCRAGKLLELRRAMSKNFHHFLIKPESLRMYAKFPDLVREIVNSSALRQNLIKDEVDLVYVKQIYDEFGVPDDAMSVISSGRLYEKYYAFFKKNYPEYFDRLLRFKKHGFDLMCESLQPYTYYDFFVEIITDYIDMFKRDFLKEDKNLTDEQALKRAKELIVSDNCPNTAFYKQGPFVAVIRDSVLSNETLVVQKLDYFYKLGGDPTKPNLASVYPISAACRIMGRVVAWFLDRGASPTFNGTNIILTALKVKAPIQRIQYVYERYPICADLLQQIPSEGTNALYSIFRNMIPSLLNLYGFLIQDMDPACCSQPATATPLSLLINELLYSGNDSTIMAVEVLASIFKNKSRHLFLDSDIDILRRYKQQNPTSSRIPVVDEMIELTSRYVIPAKDDPDP